MIINMNLPPPLIHSTMMMMKNQFPMAIRAPLTLILRISDYRDFRKEKRRFLAEKEEKGRGLYLHIYIYIYICEGLLTDGGYCRNQKW